MGSIRGRLRVKALALGGVIGGFGFSLVHSATPTIIASGLTSPGNIIIDSSNVYWVATQATGEGTIQSVSISGGAVKTYPGSLTAGNLDIQENSDSLFFIGGANDNFSVDSVPKAGGAVSTLSPNYVEDVPADGVVTGSDLAVVGDVIYTEAANYIPHSGEDFDYIATLPTQGGGFTPLTFVAGGVPAGGGPYQGGEEGYYYLGLAALNYDNENYYLGSDPAAFSNHNSYLYWTDGANIWRMPMGGGEATAIVTGGQSIVDVITPTTGAAAGSIFWSDEGTGNLMRRDTSGNITTVVTGISMDQTRCFAVSGGEVYCSQNDNLVEASINGGAVTDLVSNADPQSLAVDSANVYWSDGDGNINKLALSGSGGGGGVGTATVKLSNLTAVYNGKPQAVTVTTVPAGLKVLVAYATTATNGTLTPPTAVGTYLVEAVVDDPNYTGSATGTLVITKAKATVTLGNLTKQFNNSPQPVTVTTSPSGLKATITYNGSSAPPTALGTYKVVATINDPNYTGSATGTLVISPAIAQITLGNLTAVYNGAFHSVSVTTVPADLPYTITYGATPNPPVNAGAYTVVVTIEDANYTGSATNLLVISKANARVTFGSLAATYSGKPIAATATTTPANLPVQFTYNGKSSAPVTPGSYTVVATVNNGNYTGTNTGVLVISKAKATVTLGHLTAVYSGKPIAVTATTVPTGLPVTFTYTGSATPPTAVGKYNVVATINSSDYSGNASGVLNITAAAKP
jgi:uncharacterized protein with FMN-binding domain